MFEESPLGFKVSTLPNSDALNFPRTRQQKGVHYEFHRDLKTQSQTSVLHFFQMF